jgi:hypothetical protein
MDTLDQTRMTLRLPKDLREALERAVLEGSSASVTAEIISRLRKSFELNPINNEDPKDLIKQCAATILDVVTKLDKKSAKTPIMQSKQTQQVIDDDKKLLDEFSALPKNKRKTAISLFMAITSLIKS